MKKKGDKLYVKWKGYVDCFNSWVDKKHIVQILYKISQHFPKPYEHPVGNVKV